MQTKPEKSNNKMWLGLVAGVCLLFVIIGLVSNGGGDENIPETAEPAPIPVSTQEQTNETTQEQTTSTTYEQATTTETSTELPTLSDGWHQIAGNGVFNGIFVDNYYGYQFYIKSMRTATMPRLHYAHEDEPQELTVILVDINIKSIEDFEGDYASFTSTLARILREHIVATQGVGFFEQEGAPLKWDNSALEVVLDYDSTDSTVIEKLRSVGLSTYTDLCWDETSEFTSVTMGLFTYYPNEFIGSHLGLEVENYATVRIVSQMSDWDEHILAEMRVDLD